MQQKCVCSIPSEDSSSIKQMLKVEKKLKDPVALVVSCKLPA